jgi:carbon starvation protein CstA
VPLAFVATTTLYAGWRNIFDNFLPLMSVPGQRSLGFINVTLTGIIMICAIIILIESARRVYRVLVLDRYTVNGEVVLTSDAKFKAPDFGEA